MDPLSLDPQQYALPSPLPVVCHIHSIVSNPDSTITEVVSALRMDPVIVGKVLRLANSAFTGIPETISSLQNAVAILGQKRIVSLIVASNVTSAAASAKKIPLQLERFWRHATATALIAESIAKHLKRYDAIDEQEIFSGALLHDIGKLILAVAMPDTLQTIFQHSISQSKPMSVIEDPESSHTNLGGRLATAWGFPPELRAAILEHHAPRPDGSFALSVSIIHVADVMVHLAGRSTFEGERSPEIDPAALERIRLPPERLRVITATELENQKRIEGICSLFQG